MNNSVGKNNRYVRNMNRIGIVGLLRDYGSLTKAEIAAKMNLTFTAVNNLVEELMKERVIIEAGLYVDSSRGRKPKLISLNPADKYTVGVHISASSPNSDDQGMDVVDVIHAGLAGDPLAANILHESARYVGISLANIMNLLTPETIILGGVLANRYPDFFNHVKETSVNRSLSSLHNKVVLQPSELGEDAGIIGAGTMVFEKYLSDISD